MSHVVEQVYRTFDRSREMRPRGLKPSLLLGALRGAEAPLFHGTACFIDLFQVRDGAEILVIRKKAHLRR